jgi:hypothetical protein
MVTAFAASLLSGFLVIRLLYQTNWWFYLLMLLPLFVGGVGMLTVSPHNPRPSFTGRMTAWPAWLGIWLSFLVWEAFHPHMIVITTSGCWAAGCDPGVLPIHETDPLPFPLVFIGFFLCYVIGLAFIEVGLQLALKYRTRRGKQPSVSM